MPWYLSLTVTTRSLYADLFPARLQIQPLEFRVVDCAPTGAYFLPTLGAYGQHISVIQRSFRSQPGFQLGRTPFGWVQMTQRICVRTCAALYFAWTGRFNTHANLPPYHFLPWTWDWHRGSTIPKLKVPPFVIIRFPSDIQSWHSRFVRIAFWFLSLGLIMLRLLNI